MGVIKDKLLELGWRRRQAEEVERELRLAGVTEPEEREKEKEKGKVEVKKTTFSKNISEIKSMDGGD